MDAFLVSHPEVAVDPRVPVPQWGLSEAGRARLFGSGSDGNFTAASGMPTLDELGAVGSGAHADHEYLLVDAMAERADLVAGLVGAIRSTQWHRGEPLAPAL